MNEKLKHYYILARLRHKIEDSKRLGKKLKIVREIKERIDKARHLNSR